MSLEIIEGTNPCAYILVCPQSNLRNQAITFIESIDSDATIICFDEIHTDGFLETLKDLIRRELPFVKITCIVGINEYCSNVLSLLEGSLSNINAVILLNPNVSINRFSLKSNHSLNLFLAVGSMPPAISQIEISAYRKAFSKADYSFYVHLSDTGTALTHDACFATKMFIQSLK